MNHNVNKPVVLNVMRTPTGLGLGWTAHHMIHFQVTLAPGFVILYAGCLIIWASKMQQLIPLSTTDTALCEVIAVIHLLDDLCSQEFHIFHPTPKITCHTFEDNNSCIEIATNHKTRPRMFACITDTFSISTFSLSN
jgi:hypothetical protein